MQIDISKLESITLSSVADGYDAFLLKDFAHSQERDILYITSDGLSMEHAA